MKRLLVFALALGGLAGPAAALTNCSVDFGDCITVFSQLPDGYHMQWECSNGDQGGGWTTGQVYSYYCGGGG